MMMHLDLDVYIILFYMHNYEINDLCLLNYKVVGTFDIIYKKMF